MHDAPVDAWYVWLGVSTAAIAVLGVVLALPTTAPPDASTAAAAVDQTAAAPPGAVAAHRLDARRIRLDGRTVGLENEGGRAHATVTADAVVPAFGTSSLGRIVEGTPPNRVFPDGSAFERAVNRASEEATEWRPAPERLVIRRVRWEGVDVTLVG